MAVTVSETIFPFTIKEYYQKQHSKQKNANLNGMFSEPGDHPPILDLLFLSLTQDSLGHLAKRTGPEFSQGPCPVGSKRETVGWVPGAMCVPVVSICSV